MDVELITVGDELLLGQTINTNAAEIARSLGEIGASVQRATTIRDERDAIVDAVQNAMGRVDVVITTGGLGPTRDDVTKVAVAEALGLSLERDESYVTELRERFARMRPGPMPESNLTQADVPTGGERLANPLGSAPGLWVEKDGTIFVMLPGVPREMRGLMTNQVVPRLRNQAGDRVILSRSYRTTGISESALADDLRGVEERMSPLTLAFLPSLEGVDLRLTARNMPRDQAEELLNQAESWFLPMLGSSYYLGEDLAAVVVASLRSTGLTLSSAESCTGGMVGKRITAVPGCSDVYLGSIVAYSNDVKENVLGVPRSLLDEHGAVSASVAEAMAFGAVERLGSDTAVSTTGIAGPGGGSKEKPVGTVYMAAVVHGRSRSISRVFPGDRDDIRRRSTQACIDLLRRMLDDGDTG